MGLALVLLAGCDGGGGGEDAGLDASTEACAADFECTDGIYCTGVERCDASDPGADARGCVTGPPPCAAGEVCDEAGSRCYTEGCANPDADGDGQRSVACGGGDCDDDDPSRYPGNTEVCDSADNDEDCDDSTFGYRDQDSDGNPDANCCNGTNCGRDCDDTDPTIGMDSEFCDGRDNDCNGMIDDLPGGGSCACTVVGETRDCGPDRATYDGVGACQTGTETCAAGVWVCAGAIGVSEERCNGLDDDCDGMTDETFSCEQGATVDCGPVTDSVSWPGVTRTCADAGTSVCSALCGGGACVASSEDCDYCDDDGDGIEDEIPLATAMSQTPLNPSTNCEQLGRSACATGTLIGSAGRTGLGGLFRSESFTVGYGRVRVGWFVGLEAAGFCGGRYSLVVYREPGALALGADSGVDRTQTGVSVEVHLNSMSAVPTAGVTMRQLPSTASSRVESAALPGGVPCYLTAGDYINLRLEIEPHSPSGPAGKTQYRVLDVDDNVLISFEGSSIFPGDQLRVGVVAERGGDTTAELSLLSMDLEGQCPGGR